MRVRPQPGGRERAGRKMKTILIAEDDNTIREGLKRVSEEAGYNVLTARNGAEGLDLAAQHEVDIVFTDLKMPRMGGMEFLKAVRQVHPGVYVVMVTAFGTVETAVAAMKQGAFDYITKPFSVDQMEVVLERIEERERLVADSELFRDEMRSRYDYRRIIGNSPELLDILKTVSKVAESRSAVLIRGESGTGKELLAAAIHYQSPRKERPFIKVSCAALPEALLESELFGHEKGAFTNAESRRRGRFELADRGSIFLDEVGDMSLATQVKLLRVLQEQAFERVGGTDTIEVDIRIIAATNSDLEQSIREGTFREDLYYRLNVVPLRIPPLRERREDIPLLARHFLEKHTREAGKNIRDFAPGAMPVLMGYDWPGNVRELENTIERAVVLGQGPVIVTEHLAVGEPASRERAEVGATVAGEIGIREVLSDEEERRLVSALEQSGWILSRAARLLGLNRSSLRYRMKKFGLEGPRSLDRGKPGMVS